MKTWKAILGVGLGSLVAGCASQYAGSRTAPVAINEVGPGQMIAPNTQNDPSQGQLKVYSSLRQMTDDKNIAAQTMPLWYQHTDYVLYDANGGVHQEVLNSVGHYEQRPKAVELPPGQYYIKAHAADYDWVNVPVEIQSGHVTEVHLDDSWSPPADIPAQELVRLPDGQPVGFSATAM